MYHILIVEDDNTITNVLKRTLEKWNYQVAAVTDFSRVLEQFEQTAPDLVLLDISLPFFDGYYWCGQIRRLSQVPIIFISSASDDMNLVMAVNLGADDFLAKPFKLEVVLAKIQALLRRTYTFNEQKTVLRAGLAVLNIGDGSLASGSGKLDLTKNELRIMKCLMEQKGRVVSRDSIIRYLWESEDFIDDNTLTVNMTRLRKKLESIGLKGLIETKKGLGYLLSEAGIYNEAAMGQEEVRS
ncbi:response regulator transcription factor [Enterocloster citroniae]|uniref:response regulator transcription factor n=1 Tax=Enterocloster citroniae TaxID=358743 RepID=UPI001D089B4D|nr:response regulator transcription factor [Enterocloster citroniae]MCB7063720.1 response regulator transcription factor [Enterocloster citroniae]